MSHICVIHLNPRCGPHVPMAAATYPAPTRRGEKLFPFYLIAIKCF